jgi:hypothetical protein
MSTGTGTGRTARRNATVARLRAEIAELRAEAGYSRNREVSLAEAANLAERRLADANALLERGRNRADQDWARDVRAHLAAQPATATRKRFSYVVGVDGARDARLRADGFEPVPWCPTCQRVGVFQCTCATAQGVNRCWKCGARKPTNFAREDGCADCGAPGVPTRTEAEQTRSARAGG